MNETFETSVKEYVSKHSPKLHILTPCYGSVCYVTYVSSLMNTISILKHFQIPYQIDFCCSDSLVSRARNNLIARAMSDTEMTHILFIDADITWNPQDVLKLLLANTYVVGGVYPLKKYNWTKLAADPNVVQKWVTAQKENELFQNYPTEQYLQHKLLDYNVTHKSSELAVENNLTEVKNIACGFMMIKRETLELLQKAFPSTKYADDVSFLKEDQNKYAYALFDCGVEEGRYLSEDWMFCSRWQKLGGKAYIDVTVNLSHTGVEHYHGSFLSSVLN